MSEPQKTETGQPETLDNETAPKAHDALRRQLIDSRDQLREKAIAYREDENRVAYDASDPVLCAAFGAVAADFLLRVYDAEFKKHGTPAEGHEAGMGMLKDVGDAVDRFNIGTMDSPNQPVYLPREVEAAFNSALHDPANVLITLEGEKDLAANTATTIETHNHAVNRREWMKELLKTGALAAFAGTGFSLPQQMDIREPNRKDLEKILEAKLEVLRTPVGWDDEKREAAEKRYQELDNAEAKLIEERGLPIITEVIARSSVNQNILSLLGITVAAAGGAALAHSGLAYVAKDNDVNNSRLIPELIGEVGGHLTDLEKMLEEKNQGRGR